MYTHPRPQSILPVKWVVPYLTWVKTHKYSYSENGLLNQENGENWEWLEDSFAEKMSSWESKL